MSPDQHEELLKERGAEYGDAYAQTDRWVKDHLQELAASPSPLGLIMMHFKLTRALATPNKRDHYDDLIGYAKLVLRTLDGQRPANHWLTIDETQEDYAAELDPEYVVNAKQRTPDVSSEEYDRISGNLRTHIAAMGHTDPAWVSNLLKRMHEGDMV